jgi:hypothetical protein
VRVHAASINEWDYVMGCSSSSKSQGAARSGK